MWATDACRKRAQRPNSPDVGRNRRRSAGGLQVSFKKALDALTGPPLYASPEAAEAALVGALSERQRTRLWASRHPPMIEGQLDFETAA